MSSDHDIARTVNQALVSGGVGVDQLVRTEKGLEDVYIQLTGVAADSPLSAASCSRGSRLPMTLFVNLVGVELHQYNEKLKQRGDIDSYETVLPELHGGDLGGFTLVRGNADKLNRLRYEDEEFQSLVSRASLLVDNFGVVGAAIGERVMRQFGIFEKSVRSLQPATAGVR